MGSGVGAEPGCWLVWSGLAGLDLAWLGVAEAGWGSWDQDEGRMMGRVVMLYI